MLAITTPDPTNRPAPITPPMAIIVRWRCLRPLESFAGDPDIAAPISGVTLEGANGAMVRAIAEVESSSGRRGPSSHLPWLSTLTQMHCRERDDGHRSRQFGLLGSAQLSWHLGGPMPCRTLRVGGLRKGVARSRGLDLRGHRTRFRLSGPSRGNATRSVAFRRHRGCVCRHGRYRHLRYRRLRYRHLRFRFPGHDLPAPAAATTPVPPGRARNVAGYQLPATRPASAVACR